MIIFVVNKSTLVTDRDAYNMTLAVDWQVRHHATPAFWTRPPVVGLIADEADAPAGSCVIGILDNADQAGVLGWHTEGPDGKVYGRVFAEPVLQNGGGILTGALSVASVLSHEVLETFGDIHCNLWADLGNGQCYAYELGDPVESDSYEVTIAAPAGGEQVTASVSNFVHPAWFDPQAPAGSKLDQMGLLTTPFEVRPTGYVIVMQDGNVTEQWGEHYPEWRKDTKLSDSSRTARRVRR